ncbi:MAG: hypothetical protein IK015_07515 [Treponema sp.]|nr:hypothetical protein [Treponema sp.]
MRIIINGKKMHLRNDANDECLKTVDVSGIKKTENVIDIEGLENVVVRYNGEACFYVENSIVGFYETKTKVPVRNAVISATKGLGEYNMGDTLSEINIGISNLSSGLGETHIGNP